MQVPNVAARAEHISCVSYGDLCHSSMVCLYNKVSHRSAGIARPNDTVTHASVP